jgi:hypothetical protein
MTLNQVVLIINPPVSAPLSQMARLSGSPANFSIQKKLAADDHKMLSMSKWQPDSPLALRRKDRLELFFERRGHGQAFDDHFVQGSPGDWI